MRVQRIVPVGQSLESAALPVGEIRSVEIDNPSGQWLQLFPTYDYIAPYTVGFARTFQTTVQTVTVRVQSPAGQVSTQQGDAVKVWIDSEPAAADRDGVPFIEQFTPTLSFRNVTSRVTTTVGLTEVVIAGIANQRIRILTIHTTQGRVIGGTADARIRWTLSGTTLGSVINGVLSPASPKDAMTFPLGFDFPLGDSITLQAFQAWDAVVGGIDGEIIMFGTYQVI